MPVPPVYRIVNEIREVDTRWKISVEGREGMTICTVPALQAVGRPIVICWPVYLKPADGASIDASPAMPIKPVQQAAAVWFGTAICPNGGSRPGSVPLRRKCHGIGPRFGSLHLARLQTGNASLRFEKQMVVRILGAEPAPLSPGIVKAGQSLGSAA